MSFNNFFFPKNIGDHHMYQVNFRVEAGSRGWSNCVYWCHSRILNKVRTKHANQL